MDEVGYREFAPKVLQATYREAVAARDRLDARRDQTVKRLRGLSESLKQAEARVVEALHPAPRRGDDRDRPDRPPVPAGPGRGQGVVERLIDASVLDRLVDPIRAAARDVSVAANRLTAGARPETVQDSVALLRKANDAVRTSVSASRYVYDRLEGLSRPDDVPGPKIAASVLGPAVREFAAIKETLQTQSVRMGKVIDEVALEVEDLSRQWPEVNRAVQQAGTKLQDLARAQKGEFDSARVALEAPDVQARRQACEALGGLVYNTEVGKVLAGVAADARQSESVRRAAVATLGRSADADAVGRLTDLVKTLRNTPADVDLAKEALTSLRRSGEAGRSALAGLADSSDLVIPALKERARLLVPR